MRSTIPQATGAGSGNVRNGSRPKTVLTDSTGQVGIEVPRDRAGTSGPQIVKNRQRRLTGVNEIVLSLYAKSLTTQPPSIVWVASGICGTRDVSDAVTPGARSHLPGTATQPGLSWTDQQTRAGRCGAMPNGRPRGGTSGRRRLDGNQGAFTAGRLVRVAREP